VRLQQKPETPFPLPMLTNQPKIIKNTIREHH